MKLAAHLLEVAEEDVEYEDGRFSVKGAPDQVKSIQDVAFAAYTNFPEGMEAGLEGVYYYNPPNLTFPFGTYVVAVEVDPDTGVWKVRRMVAVDDCGVRINPMIVEGQIQGGLTEGYAIAAMQLITFDEVGNAIGTNFMDYLIPTAWETPKFELGETVTPSPHHPIGAKGVGESATVGSPAAYVNAVIDALWRVGREEHRHAGHVGEGVGGDREGEGGRLGVKPDVLRLAAELSARGEPFVLATVVWRRAPSSGKEGATALITPDAGARVARRRVRRADRRARGAEGARGGLAAPAVPRSARGARRPSARRRRHRADRVPERRSTGGLRGTRPAATAARRDRALAGRTRWQRSRPLGWRTVPVDDGGDPATIRTTARGDDARPGRRRRAVVRGRGHAGALRRGRPGACAGDARRVRRPGGVPQAGRSGARLPARSRRVRRRARARPRARRPRPRPRADRRDRRRDPRRDRAAEGRRAARGGGGRRPSTRSSHATRRSTPSAA